MIYSLEKILLSNKIYYFFKKSNKALQIHHLEIEIFLRLKLRYLLFDKFISTSKKVVSEHLVMTVSRVNFG